MRSAPQMVLVFLACTLLVGAAAGVRLFAMEDPGTGQSGATGHGNQRQAVAAPARPGLEPSLARLRADNQALKRQLARLQPNGLNLVIDTAGNRVYLRRGEKIEAEMLASCGSGNILEDPKNGRRWIFDTPRGQFTIRTKLTRPVWMKPDWAFIEEGESIPGDPAARAETGMMGDYALGLGQGYFIHGTLYTRLLGRNVSHGCVRLGDRDLERLYRILPIGSRVLIF